MDQCEYDELFDKYVELITGPSEEADFIQSVPWWLGMPGVHAFLLKGLALEASRFCEIPARMTFSLIAPLSNPSTRSLNELILSLRCQSYFHWELILVDDASQERDHLPVAAGWAARDRRIKLLALDERQGIAAAKNAALDAAAGAFVCILDDLGLLHPSALGIFARHLNSQPQVNFLFSNEARIDEATYAIRKFISKPEFDLFTILRTNYIGNLAAIRHDLLLSARREGRVFRPRYDGVEDHDLMIRIALTGKIRSLNVPLFLYYGQTGSSLTTDGAPLGPYAGTRTFRLLEEFLPEIYPQARWTLIPPATMGGNQFPGIHLRALAGHPRPSLLVMMPFKDEPEMTIRCLDSVERQEHELDVQVVMINQRSREAQTVPMLRAWADQPRRNRYEIVDHDGAFNFARMNNRVFEAFGRTKDLVLFLNNDTEMLSVDCFQTMAMQLLADPACGFVGMRLLYPHDQTVQHGGIKVWADTLYVSGCHKIDHSRGGDEFVNDERIAFGVSFAIAMTRRETFEKLGKLEEILYPNAYGDVALCARAVQAGLKNCYFGTLVGLHDEGKTRGTCQEDMEYLAVYEQYGSVLSHWRLRNLSYREVSAPAASPAVPTPRIPAPLRPSAAVAPGPTPRIPAPLRHRVADRINDSFKNVLGPAHPALRTGLHHSWRFLRAIRSRIAQGRQTVRGRFLWRFLAGNQPARGAHRSPGAAVEDRSARMIPSKTSEPVSSARGAPVSSRG
jgi:O-antigen biosynthesis protein